jgi:hypothetical protein
LHIRTLVDALRKKRDNEASIGEGDSRNAEGGMDADDKLKHLVEGDDEEEEEEGDSNSDPEESVGGDEHNSDDEDEDLVYSE